MAPTVPAIAGWLVRPFGGVVHLWRRSIQARVVIGTLALSAILSILAGWVLLSRVSDGLLESKRQAAISQAAAGTETAQSTLDGARDRQRPRRRAGAQPACSKSCPRATPRATTTSSSSPARRARTPSPSARGERATHPAISPRRHAALRPGAHRCDDRPAPTTAYTSVYFADADRRGRTGPGRRRADQRARHRPDLLAVLRVPARRAAADPASRAQRPDHRRRPARRAARHHRLAGHPTGRDAGPAGPPDRRAAGRRSPRGAHARARRGRHRPPRQSLQPDGHQPAAPDPPARGAVPRPAPVRGRRQPRAAHAAHDGADGRRRAVRRAPLVRRSHGTVRRAAADPARPVRAAAHRPARDQPVRRGSGGARARSGRPRRGRAPGHRRHGSAGRSARVSRHAAHSRLSRCSSRPTSVGSSGSSATWS